MLIRMKMKNQSMYFKKIITILMALIFIISMIGCNSKSSPSASSETVNYEGKDISKNTGLSDIINFKVNSKNQLIILGLNEAKEKKFGIYDAEGKLVKEINMNPEDQLGIFTLDNQDNIYLLAENASKKQMNIFNSSGEKVKAIAVEGLNADNTQQEIASSKAFAKKGELVIDSNGNFYVLNENHSVEMIDKDGKNNKKLYEQCNFISGDNENNLFLGSFKDYQFNIENINLSNSKTLWKTSSSISKIYTKAFFNKEDKKVYILDVGGISKCNSEDGQASEQVMDFKDYGLYDLDSSVYSFGINKNKDIYVLNTKSQLFKYVISKAKINKKIITLSLPYESMFIDAVINNFQKQHPDIKIKIENSIQDEQDASSHDKYVQGLNTQIMQGKGSDIISMSELPYEKYAGKKVFLNLNDLISEDKSFNINNYKQNIINGFKYNDGLYAIPINFSLPILTVNKKVLNEENINIDDKNWTWKELVSIAQKISKDKNNDGVIDQYAFPNIDSGYIISYILNSDYSKFIDRNKKQVKFDSKDFIDLLNVVKDLSNKKVMNPNQNFLASVVTGNFQIITGSNNVVFNFDSIFNYPIVNQDYEFLNLPAYGDNKGGSFTSENSFSINKNTKYKKECWEFIKFMLSDEIQRSKYSGGLPISKTAFEKSLKESIEDMKAQSISMNMKEFNLPNNISEADFSTLNKFIDNLSRYSNSEPEIKKIISEESSKFIKGQQTAEQAAKIIQNKVNTMINE